MKFNVYNKIALCAGSLLLFASCSTQKDLVYFSDLDNGSKFELPVTRMEAQVQPNDMLGISVNTLSPESNLLFSGANISRVSQSDSRYPSGSGTSANGYVVDKNGNINFPVLGQVKVAGLTKDQVKEKLTSEISKYVKSPIVNVEFENFKVTVIGEVNRPSTFTVTSENINLLEALGMAGDMTVYGKRENVLIIREQNGRRSLNRINLNRKDVLNSPYFYLRQNDIVYVEPDKSKGAQISAGRQVLPYIVSAASVITIVVSRLL